MTHRDPIKRREYVRKYRIKRKAMGYYGQCKVCGNNLGRNDGHKGRNKNGLCRGCNKGELNQNWKNGYITSDGYRRVVINGKYILKHRQVMEQHLGRKLYINETVHHLNGNRDDNRLKNLELWVGSPIRGIKIPDAVNWAREILKRYE